MDHQQFNHPSLLFGESNALSPEMWDLYRLFSTSPSRDPWISTRLLQEAGGMESCSLLPNQADVFVSPCLFSDFAKPVQSSESSTSTHDAEYESSTSIHGIANVPMQPDEDGLAPNPEHVSSASQDSQPCSQGTSELRRASKTHRCSDCSLQFKSPGELKLGGL